MTEQEPETTTTDTPPDGATDDGTTTDGTEQTDGTSQADDADNPGDVSGEAHVSSVTDLPEGAEVDPLTDARPEPVVESETHDG